MATVWLRCPPRLDGISRDGPLVFFAEAWRLPRCRRGGFHYLLGMRQGHAGKCITISCMLLNSKLSCMASNTSRRGVASGRRRRRRL